jgi:ankyrin repeat protein
MSSYGADLVIEANMLPEDAILLRDAILSGKVEAVKKLITGDCRIDVKAKDGQGGTALHLAAAEGNAAIVNVLIDAGTNVKDISGRTPFHWAAIGGNVEVLNLLIKNKAEINVQDENGWTPMHMAACCGNVECVKFLVQENPKGLDIKDTEKRSVLHMVMFEDRVEVLDFLISLKMKLDVRDKDGNTPMHYAASYGSIKSLKLLLDKGTKVEAKNMCGDTPFHKAVSNGNIRCVKFLIDKADVNAKSIHGTPLHYAILNNNVECVRALIKAKRIDQNIRDVCWQTPFEMAVNKGYYKIAKILMGLDNW